PTPGGTVRRSPPSLPGASFEWLVVGGWWLEKTRARGVRKREGRLARRRAGLGLSNHQPLTTNHSRGLARPGLGQPPHQVEDGAEVGQPHAVAVEELLQGEVVVDAVVLVVELVGQLDDEAAVAAFEVGHGLAAGVGQAGELVLPALEEAAPA